MIISSYCTLSKVSYEANTTNQLHYDCHGLAACRFRKLADAHMDASQPLATGSLTISFVLLCVASTRTRTMASLSPLRICPREGYLVFDAAFVVAFLDAKVALLAPERIPTVGDLPVLHTTI